MFKKIESRSEVLTPELARFFLNLPAVPGERALKISRVDYLLTQLKEGKFSGPNWAQGRDREDGLMYRLDGQHSSHMFVHLPLDISFPQGLLVTIDTFEFDSLSEDAAAVFNIFNNPKSVRTTEDIIGIYRAQVPAIAELERGLLIKLGNGIYEYEHALVSEKRLLFHPRDRGLYFARYDKYVQFAIWAADFDVTKNRAFLSRPAIVAEMVDKFMKSPSQADKFWNLVFSESHPDVDHETRTLAQLFRDWSFQSKHRPQEYRLKVSKAWKLYLKTEQLERDRNDDDDDSPAGHLPLQPNVN